MRYHDGCFAECLKDDTRQRIYIIFSWNCLPSVGSRQRIFYFFKKSLFASVCGDTRQSLPLCRVPWPDTRQRAQLCRVSLPLHSAKLGNLVFSCSFCQLCRVQCPLHSTKRPLPSVTLGKASIIAYFFSCFYIPTLPSHIQTENFTDIHHILQIHDIHHTSIPLSHIHHLHITNTI